AVEIGAARPVVIPWCHGAGGSLGNILQRLEYSRLVDLGDLPRREVEFEAVPVGGYVAAGHHHSRRVGGLRGKRQAGCRQQPAIHRYAARLGDGGRDPGGDRRAALAQIPPDEHPIARTEYTLPPQIGEKGRRVATARRSDEIARQSAQAAGTEFETVRHTDSPGQRGDTPQGPGQGSAALGLAGSGKAPAATSHAAPTAWLTQPARRSSRA